MSELPTYNSFGELAVANMDVGTPSGIFPTATFNMAKVMNVPQFRKCRFYTCASEEQHGAKLEPKHVHVWTPEGKAKFWLGNSQQDVVLAENNGISGNVNEGGEIADIRGFVVKNWQGFVTHWVEKVEKQHEGKCNNEIPAD